MNATAAARHIDLFHGSPMSVISSCLRGMLRAAPGNVLVAADYSNIEGRGLVWLSGESWKLNMFREYDASVIVDERGVPIRKNGKKQHRNPDPYKVMASEILGKPVEEITDDERQASGKVPELACGYQGGVGAFQTMAKVYGVTITDSDADAIKDRWRTKHPKTVQFWYDLGEAAEAAVRSPGTVTKAGRISFRVKGSFLWCRLPSNRMLCYPYARIDDCYTYRTPSGALKKISARTRSEGVDDKWIEERFDADALWYMHVDGLSNKWGETTTYGGKLAENVTQAICRDLLAYSIRQAEDAGYPVVLHVHDEVVSEVPEGFGSLDEFESICARTPAWADGLPVVTEGWVGSRYRK
jgi:DNA polymerase